MDAVTLDLRTQGILDNQTPFTFDVKAAEELYDELDYEKTRLNFRLAEAFGRTVSTKTFIDLAKIKYDWEPTLFTAKGNPQMTEEALALMPFPESDLMIEYMTVTKILGFVRSWLSFRIGDTISHTCIANGTATSRVSHCKPNLGQIPSPKGNALKMDLGARCRAMFGPPKGFIQMGIDVSGLELGMLAHYLFKLDDGDYAKAVTLGDIHNVNKNAANLKTRDSAKEFIFSWLYGAGLELLCKKLGLPNIELTRIVSDNFLNNTKGLKKLKEAIEKKVNDTGELRTITGRLIKCDSAHKGLNYLLQSAGAELTKTWMCVFHTKMAKAGFVYGKDWHQMAYVFDELQIAVRNDSSSVLISHICLDSLRLAGEHYNLNVPMKGVSKVGLSWKNTH